MKKSLPKAKSTKNIRGSTLFRKEKKSKPKINTEQDILDACWSESTMGDKLRDKLMKQVKEINKSQYPLTSKYTKQSNRATPSARGMGKKNMSSLVLMIEQPNQDKIKIPGVCTTRPNVCQSFRCTTPVLNQLNCSFAGRITDVNDFGTQRRQPSNSGMGSVRNNSRAGNYDEYKPLTSDNSVYKTLRDQLNKITLKLDTEDYSCDDTMTSGKRQRRTREERSGRNTALRSGTSMLVERKLDAGLPKDNEEKENSGIPQQIKGELLSMKETFKKPFTRNQLNSSTKSYNNAKNEFPVEGSYCTTKVNQKTFKKVNTRPSKLPADPNRHLARKYLLDMYSKINLKIKDIMKGKKTAAPSNLLKKVANNYATSRNSNYSKTTSKQSIKTKGINKRMFN